MAGRAGQGREEAGFPELLAQAAPVGMGRWALVEKGALAWGGWDPHPTEFNDPARVLGDTWTYQGLLGG